MSDRTPDINEWQLAESPWPVEGRQIYLLFFFFLFFGGVGGLSQETMWGMLWKQWWDSPQGISVCALTEGLIRMRGETSCYFQTGSPV